MNEDNLSNVPLVKLALQQNIAWMYILQTIMKEKCQSNAVLVMLALLKKQYGKTLLSYVHEEKKPVICKVWNKSWVSNLTLP